MTEELYSRQQLCRIAGVPDQTVHFWFRHNLLWDENAENFRKHRRFHRRELFIAAVLGQLRELDLSIGALSEIASKIREAIATFQRIGAIDGAIFEVVDHVGCEWFLAQDRSDWTDEDRLKHEGYERQKLGVFSGEVKAASQRFWEMFDFNSMSDGINLAYLGNVFEQPTYRDTLAIYRRENAWTVSTVGELQSLEKIGTPKAILLFTEYVFAPVFAALEGEV